MEWAAKLEEATRTGDPLTALHASAEIINQVEEMQLYWVDRARAKGVKDKAIAAAIQVTDGRVRQRFGNRTATMQRIQEELEAMKRQIEMDGAE